MKPMNPTAWLARKSAPNLEKFDKELLAFADAFAELVTGTAYDAAYAKAWAQNGQPPMEMVKFAVAMIYYFFEGGEAVLEWWNAKYRLWQIKVDPNKRVVA